MSKAPRTEEDWVCVPRIQEDVMAVPTTPDKPITARHLDQKIIHRHAKSSQPANLILDVLEQNGAPELARLLTQRKV